MITVEITDGARLAEGLAELQVSCDEAGLKLLYRQIEFLLEGESHVHLKTKEWAGNELDSAPLAGGDIIHHMVLTKLSS